MKVFVSSTTKDLGDARKKVCDQLLQLNLQPDGMDFYTSDPNPPKQLDQTKVDECDAVVVIVGHLYGSSPKGGKKSFTELEYDVAIASGKPVYPFMASDEFLFSSTLREDDATSKKLQAFRDRLQKNYTIAYFNTIENLCTKVVAAFSLRRMEEKSNRVFNLIETFKEFLKEKKGYPEKTIRSEKIDPNQITMKSPRTGLELVEPESDRILAVAEFKSNSNDFSLRQASEQVLREKEFLNAREARGYIICPAVGEESQFLIFEISKDAKTLPISLSSFPSYNELLDLVSKDLGKENESVLEYGTGGVATIQMDQLSKVDLLDREGLVSALAGLFVHSQNVEGFTVALLGDWGEGKSTVMGLLEEHLKHKYPGRFDFAKFNVWEYEHTDNIPAGLAQQVVKGLNYKCEFNLKFLWNLYRKIILLLSFALLDHWRGLVVKMMYLSIPCLVIFLMYQMRVIPDEYLRYYRYGFWGILLFASIYLFKNAKFIFEHPLLTSMETYLRLPDYGKHLGLVPVLKRHISTLCKLKLDAIEVFGFKWGKDRKLVVFVDDLDRCQTRCIAHTLDAIRLVMSIPNVIVMIGIDHRIAFKAMENYYRKLGDGKGDRRSIEIARDYLAKIIQLPIRLSTSSSGEILKYIDKRLFPDALEIDSVKQPDINLGKEISPTEVTQGEFDSEDLKLKPELAEAVATAKPKSAEEILKDTAADRNMFYDLTQEFHFMNPRLLLRLRNSYRFLKVLDSAEVFDRKSLMRMLFWQDFLNSQPPQIQHVCMDVLQGRLTAEKIGKVKVKEIIQSVKEEILKLYQTSECEALENFVRIVVLPHS
ncbi:MAG: DUF4062 domain-containing protein [Planctomycetes bacterium]|nr:DUF4062 domain-containing protein [Planctomycetota bacterium]